MSKDWWPTPLKHIPAENPWAHDHVTVAEVKSFNEQPHAGHRRSITALVPVNEVDAVKKSLAKFDHEISTSGPHPFYSEDRIYKPTFWIDARDLASERYEPLVLQWASHHSTVLQPDPGFLMTYGLVPRFGRDGIVYWDDPEAPRHDIVTVSPPSVWDFPLGTHAYVSIAKDFLQDYLTLRHMALVQVFWELRWANIDADVRERLGDKEGINVDFADRRFQLGRYLGDRDTIYAQVWGARLIASPGELPITSDPLDAEGLVWPGIDKPVTNSVARTLGIGDYVYVDDTVLADFEGRPEFKINPESGSVTHGTQWSVGYCTRVGRNLIRLEAKKLYEGARPNIIRHWHKFAADPVPKSAYPAILDEPNIGKRAKDLTFAVVELGEALAALAAAVGLPKLVPEDFVALRRSALKYYGWWTFDTPEAIGRHVSLTLSADAFLDRCLSLDKLVIEGLSEANLRRTLHACGVPPDQIAGLGTLKLLDHVVRVAQIADSTGLSLIKNGAILWDRLEKEGTEPAQPVTHLFALHDLRILKAHNAGDRNKQLQNELERFNIAHGEGAAGYGKVLDQIYDFLIAELRAAADKIAAVIPNSSWPGLSLPSTSYEPHGSKDVDTQTKAGHDTVSLSKPVPIPKMPAKTPFYITTAISYPNGPPHIGHAYEAIATDAIARFMRLDGYDVYFLTGTDEHGMKIQQTAGREALTPHELLERNVPRFKAMVERLECSNDDFIRTTEERHHRSSEEIWRRMEANGDIYLDKYAGWYSVRDEAYYAEDETELRDGARVSKKTGTPVDWVEEESYFFRLSAYQQKLLDLYARPNYVLPKERLNEVASFVRGGLQDLSISRTTFDWGIRVPGNPKHIMYVWVDALTNYITGVGFPDTESEKFKRYWPAALHVIGKDIVRFHAVYWPAFLMSAGIAVPQRIFSHGFLFNRGEKMSKSVGNVIDPFALADAYGVDPLRYFFLREVPFGQDGNYSHEAIVNRINADLANDLGNLAQRSLSMIGKAFGGVLPAPGEFTAEDKTILAAADGMIATAREHMKTQQLHQVLNCVWAVVADANRYFASEAPWAKAKTDPQRQGTILYVTAEVLRCVAIMAQPFVPSSAAKLLELLAVRPEQRSFYELNGSKRIAPGSKLPPPLPVFPRYVEPEAKA